MNRIVVVDTMGGLGDLLLTLPSIQALALTHPGARLVVVTTAPWHELLERDERIARVVPVPGRDGATVVATATAVLERERPDLAVTTNRQHGLPALLERTAGRAITDLWRRPPADEPVDLRFLRILGAEGVIDPALLALPPRLVLGAEEVVAGEEVLDALGAVRPVLLLPDSGMPVKHWPLRGLGGRRPRPGRRRGAARRGVPGRPSSGRRSAPPAPPPHRRCRSGRWRGSPPRPRSAAGARSAATPGRCGWPPLRGWPSWACSAPRSPAATATAGRAR